MSEQNQKSSYETDIFAQTYPETTPFWQAAAEGKLFLKGCDDCHRAHWYPRVVCPLCGSEQTHWSQASGRGTIYSFSVMERADPPVALAWVELEEGPIMITNIVDCDFSTLKIGDKVSVRFQVTKEGRSAPFFAPV